MPRTPESIGKRIDPFRSPPKLGEEGVLNPILFAKEKYWAKEWRSKHHREPGRVAFGYEAHDWKTQVSPFWAKLKYYEAKLIHQALPELTLAIEAAYDPRVSKTGGEFEFRKGRPVTVARDVSGDPQLRRQRDAMIDELYDEHFSSWILNEDGRMQDDQKNGQHLYLWARTDEEIYDLFGECLDMRSLFYGRNMEDPAMIRYMIERTSEAYPGSITERMVKAGVIPIHASVNYIPTRSTGQNQTEGIFLETRIVDEGRLVDAILQTRANECELAEVPYDVSVWRSEMKRRLERLHVLQNLDECWDRVYYSSPTNRHLWSLRWDSELAERFFQILQAVLDDPKKAALFTNGLPWQIDFALYDLPYTEDKAHARRILMEIEQTIQQMADASSLGEIAA